MLSLLVSMSGPFPIKINARRKSYDLGKSQFWTLNCVPYVNIFAKTLYLLFGMAEEKMCSKIDTRDITTDI